ncbi:MAG: hypothetical protein JNL70_24610 [Saprospiraceae bacterium]|nr:hypothetical protein [Saprospiraceae bacterium]
MFLLPLSIFSQNLFAQVEDLLKNKNITWAAEIMTDFAVEDEERDEKPLPPVNIHTLKVMPPREIQDVNLNELFENIVSNAIFQKNKPVFKDSLLQKPISRNTLKGLDTFRTVDSLTGEVRFKIVICSRQTHEKYQYFRARQILYYNASKTQFGLLTIAFAPMICRRNESGEVLDTVPYVWIPAQSILKSPKLSSSNIIWAKRLYIREGTALEKMKILKKTDDDMPVSRECSKKCVKE